jgi:hypothetical protein
MRIFFIVLLTTLCSCHTVKTTTDNFAKSKVDVENSSAENVDNSIEKVEEVKTECGSHLITYDTSKPVDVKTGRPPIQSELISEKKIWSESECKAKSNSQITTIHKSNVKTESKNQTTQKPIINWIEWVIVGVGLTIALLLIWKFGWSNLTRRF